MRSPLDLAVLASGEYRSDRFLHTCRPHGLTNWLLHFTVSGVAWFRAPDGKEFECRSGDLVLMAPRKPQKYGSYSGSVWDVIWFAFEADVRMERWLLDWPMEGDGHYRLALSEEDCSVEKRIRRQLRRAHRLNESGGAHAPWISLNALETALISAAAVNSEHVSCVDKRIKRARDYISRNLGNRLSLTTVAEVANLSRSQLNRLFATTYNVSVASYIEECRLRRAKQLLETTPLSVKEVSGEVGFSSASYFSARFRQWSGYSPSHYSSITHATRAGRP